jgi:hypothetical protein
VARSHILEEWKLDDDFYHFCNVTGLIGFTTHAALTYEEYMTADGSLIKYEDFAKEKQVEEVKMLSDNINEPLLDLDKCSLN